MSDRLFFPLIGLAALAIVALALVWPQGIGRRSLAPFGHAASENTAAPKLRTPIIVGKPPPRS